MGDVLLLAPETTTSPSQTKLETYQIGDIARTTRFEQGIVSKCKAIVERAMGSGGL
jgi:hypothetical protein